MDLAAEPLPADTIGLLEGLTTTRSIRRYTDEPVPEAALRAMLFAATRAPSGSNRQPFRFIVLTDGDVAREAKRLVGEGARRSWGHKRAADGYDAGSGVRDDSPKARMARTMQTYVDDFERAPVLVLPCLQRYRAPWSGEGASVYPACQNLLLAARALGFGGVLSMWHELVQRELRALLRVPEEVVISATITIGRPVGHHGPVRRRPLAELVYGERWGAAPEWAVDPPTRATPRPARRPPHLRRLRASSANLALLGAYSDAMARGDEEAVFQFWAPHFVSHVTRRVNPDAVGTDVRGEEVKWWASARSAFPDMTFTVDLLIEHGDLVVSNWTVRGTHTGTAFYGVEPSGEPVEINGTAILRIVDGKVVEHWGGPHCQDGVGLTHQGPAPFLH